MSSPRRMGGLGRGLGALIPTGPDAQPPADPAPARTGEQEARGTGPAGSGEQAQPAASGPEAHRRPGGARFAELPLEAIRPNPLQPRTSFDPDALAELVASVREVGLLQPVVVREVGGDRPVSSATSW